MPQQTIFSANQINLFKQWLADHSNYDWLQMDWQDEAVLNPLLGKESTTLLPLLKAYQRLLRIIPAGHEELALPLLAKGLHSAVQIASLTRQQFLKLTRDLILEQPEVMATIYRYAQSPNIFKVISCIFLKCWAIILQKIIQNNSLVRAEKNQCPSKPFLALTKSIYSNNG